MRRGGKYNPLPLNINEVINDTIVVSERSFDKNISILHNLDEDICTIEADQNQLHQIFTNLFINAKDAMPNGGKLIITTENIELNGQYVDGTKDIDSGKYVKVSVADTGIGMQKEILDRIFEPFFTTKGKDKGTGLGLATVYGIVRNHGGDITVQSDPGNGSVFSLYFPRH